MGGSVAGKRELDGEASSYNDNKVVFAGEEENHTPPPSPVQDILIDLDETAENLFFSEEDDAFPSLADFPCLSSPSASPSISSVVSTHSNTVPYFSIKSSSTASSETGPMQPPRPPTMQVSAATSEDPVVPIDAGFDIAEDETDIWENCTEERTDSRWEPSSSFSGETPTEEKVGFLCGGDDCSSEDLANVFLEWLKRNKDSISPEDLRSIKLKRSTIECAARRLGGGKQGRVQLLKLILSWVQNHHLQKRRRRSRGSETIGRRDQEYYNDYPAPPPPISTCTLSFPQEATTSNQNNIDFHYEAVPCNSWIPAYTGEPSFQPRMPGYINEAVPPNYYYNDQAALSAEPWQQGFSPAVHYSPFGQIPRPPPPPAAHFLPVYYPGLMASATKEARKKRMARHRRSSSLHQHRSQQQEEQNQQQHSSDTMVVGEETSSAYSNVNKKNSSNWPFLSSLQADIPSLSPGVATPSSATMAQMQQENRLHSHASSAGDRRCAEGMKAEKNYKFLLQKVLKQSDVGNLGRIVLPKKEAEINLPELDARDGITIEMEDIGTSRVWNMRYRFWPNNKSRMYLLENTGEFVRSNGLEEGDFIVIYSDVKCGKYLIRGVKVRQPVEMMVKGTSNHNSRKAHQKKEKNNSTMAVDDKGKSPYALGN